MATPLRPFPRPTSRPPVTPSPNLFARKARPVSSPTQKEISMGWRLMGTWTVLSAMIMLTLLLLFGCAKEVPLPPVPAPPERSEEHTSELQSRPHLVCRLLLEKKTNPNVRGV